METSNTLSLYVAYYLARFDIQGYENLSYPSWKAAYEDIARRLQDKPASIKNKRDEFDPLFGHRAGWHQRPMIPSRMRVAQLLEDLDEPQIRGIVKDILSGKLDTYSDEAAQLMAVAAENNGRTPGKFILRLPTGRAAEQYFISYYRSNKKPIEGELEDCRDLGCGYDFKIVSLERTVFVEVKGMADIAGGVLLTDKEWNTAKENTDDYFLCIVKNVSAEPTIDFIPDPVHRLNPQKTIYTTIQINWGISQGNLNSYLNKRNSGFP